MMKRSSRNIILACGILLGICASGSVRAVQETYPKLANYYLKYYELITPSDFEQLKKWDLLIIPNEVGIRNPGFIKTFKEKYPDKLVFAYTVPGLASDWPTGLYRAADAAHVLLRGGSGEKLQVWDKAYAVNVTNPAWYPIHFDFISKKMAQAKWDGIFYDTVEGDIRRYSTNGIDINGDGSVDPWQTVNKEWQKGTAAMMKMTRERFPDKKVIINGSSVPSFQPNINGRMFETFPAPWEGSPRWQASMYPYLRRLPAENQQPNIYVINTNTENRGDKNNYRLMRLGLTSTLLGEGYFSFDYGDQDHGQLWWYDEYDVKLGHAVSSYYNLRNPNDDYVKAGLWRRDFDNGVAIVNSTDQDQTFVFNHEEFERLKGTQDPNVNSGAKVNYIKLPANDGVIMRTVRKDVIGQLFTNGDLARVFNTAGQQTRSGFFLSKADAVSGARLLIDDLDRDGRNDRIVEREGKLVVTRGGKSAITISPFGANFKGRLSFAVYDMNKDGEKEIYVVPASGGGPQVMVFTPSGKRLTPGFFAFDKNFRGGVNLAVGDVNNDGRGEIVVAAASGMAPTVKILDEQGRAISSFLAYAATFRGGVNLAIGDVDGDGKNDLVTGPNAGGPHVRIFSSAGTLKAQFMAFDPNGRTGVRVMAADSDGDGKKEIIASTANF